MKHILITGGAGFIGSSLAEYLVNIGENIIIIDNFNDYYSPELKEKNLKDLRKSKKVLIFNIDVENANVLFEKLCEFEIKTIVHLAAKAGVRPSIENPVDYLMTNVIGTQNILDLANRLNIKKVIFASSSSVYGANPNFPWREDDLRLEPISPYAASKIASENCGKVYASLYGIQFIALRFFTVYGPRQRPDLAINKFIKLIKDGAPLSVFGDGNTQRDYTYIDDIVEGIYKAINFEGFGFHIFNLGNSNSVTLLELIKSISLGLGLEAKLNFMEEQAGDVSYTLSNISKAKKELGYNPKVMIAQGIVKYIEWIESGR